MHYSSKLELLDAWPLDLDEVFSKKVASENNLL